MPTSHVPGQCHPYPWATSHRATTHQGARKQRGRGGWWGEAGALAARNHPRGCVLGRSTAGRWPAVPEGSGAAVCCAAEEPPCSSQRERRFPTHSLEEASFKTLNFRSLNCRNKTNPGPRLLLFSSGLKKIKSSWFLAPGSHDIHMAEVGNAAAIFSPHFFVFAARPHQQPTLPHARGHLSVSHRATCILCP